MGSGLLMQMMARYLVVVILGVLLQGCSSTPHLHSFLVANAERDICRVAVLPFENWTAKNTLTQLGTRIFSSEIIKSGNFKLVQEGNIGMFYLRQRLLPGSLLHKEHYANLVDQLNLDAVIQGRVVEAGKEVRRGAQDVPYLSLQVEVFSARTGRTLVNSVHQRWGDDYRKVMHFGVVTTNSGLMQNMSQEIISDWIAKGVGCR